MLAVDEDALICDLAQTYNIHNYTDYPCEYIATLASGLNQNSRIKMALNGEKLTLEQSLLAVACDRLGWLIWAKTKDGQRGRNKPKSIYEALTKENEKEYKSMTIEEYERLRKEEKGNAK